MCKIPWFLTRIVNKKHATRLTTNLEDSKDEIVLADTLIWRSIYWAEPYLIRIGLLLLWKMNYLVPLLPNHLRFHDLDKTIVQINKRSKPLALYIFSKDKNLQNKLSLKPQGVSGGVTINNTIFSTLVL